VVNLFCLLGIDQLAAYSSP